MKSISNISHITPPDGNIFLDLGFEPAEAEVLLAESNRIIEQRLAIKSGLMKDIAQWIKLSQLKQKEAADILGVTRPRISDVMNGKGNKFTIDALVDMVARAGKKVDIQVN